MVFGKSFCTGIILLLIAAGDSFPQNGCRVTYIANEGFLVEAANKKILIDALFGGIKGNWCDQPGDSVSRLMMKGITPFENIDALLITHRHTDHFNARMVIEFLKNNRQTDLICPGQVNELLKRNADYSYVSARIRSFYSSGPFDTSVVVNDANIRVMRFDHGSYYMTDSVTGKSTDIHREVENFAYLIDAGGFTVFHPGDGSATNKTPFEIYHLAEKEIDLAFLDRTFLGREGQALMNEYLHANHIVFMHIEPGRSAYYKSVISSIPEMFIFSGPLEGKVFQ